MADATHLMRSVAILHSFSLKDECDIGPVGDWPVDVQDAVAFVLELDHPAALFVNDELIVIHNEAWGEICVSYQQGKSARLSDKTSEALKSAIDGKVSPKLVGKDFGDVEDNCAALCSPVASKAVIVQLLYKQTTAKKKYTNQDLALDKQPFFKMFAEMLPTGLAILDHDAEALYLNQHFHELTVHRGLDKSFKEWPKTIHPEDYDRVMSSYKEAFASRQNLSIEFRAHGKSNPWRLFLMRPLGDNNLQHSSLRSYGGFICAVVDITSVKAAELAQKQVARDAQERKVQQERFIDMISHEIRNPLSAILHCTEDIVEASQSNKAADIVEACDTIQLCVTHQKTLVDDILSFSKLDSSMLTLVPKRTKPKWQMAESLKIFQPELRKRRIEFDYKMEPSYEENHVKWVMADLVRISQVLVNLMTNAIKFTAGKKSEKKISVDIGATSIRPTSYPPDVVFFESDESVSRVDHTSGEEWGEGDVVYILVAIRDTGIGISIEDQAKLFDRFKQATPRTEEMYGGSGLGLNISRKICQLHGGEIGVSSKEGAGSTFGFFFTVRKSEDQSDGKEKVDADAIKEELVLPDNIVDVPTSKEDELEVLNAPRTEEASNDDNRWNNTVELVESMNDKDKKENEERIDQSAAARTSAKKVLFVEDNLINQKILKRKMELKGFNVVTANNGKEAVEAFKASNGTFDVVLMDQEMPVMDGNTATKAIRSFESENGSSRIRIIGVTANVREEQQSEMLEAGMDTVVSKPFKIDDLVKKMF